VQEETKFETQQSSSETEQQPKKVIDDAELKRRLNDGKPSLIESNKHHVVTIGLIIINLVIFAFEIMATGFNASLAAGLSVSTQVLVDMGAMYVPAIESLGDLYRFITPMFLHVNAMHIAFNMVALFSIGGMLERVLGKANYLLLYFIGGITGNAMSYIADSFFMEGFSVSAGASTSVFGLFLAAALLGLLYNGDRRRFKQFSTSMLSIIAINVAITFFVPNISISGHLGGALGGLIAMFMIPSKNLKVHPAIRVLVAILWVGSLVFLLIYQGLLRF